MPNQRIKVTIESESGNTEVYEVYSLIAMMTKEPKTAEKQAVSIVATGRLSNGDYLSTIVAAIRLAAQKLAHLPDNVRREIILHAMSEGLYGMNNEEREELTDKGNLQ